VITSTIKEVKERREDGRRSCDVKLSLGLHRGGRLSAKASFKPADPNQSAIFTYLKQIQTFI
jgi:hypothetical protein